MKILFISHHLKGNDGWSRYARDLLIELKKNGVEVLCLVNEFSPETDVTQEVCLKEPLLYLANPFLSMQAAANINRAIKKFSPDIVHFIVEPYATAIPFIKNQNLKFFLTVHSTYAFMPILVSGFKKIISRYLTTSMYGRLDRVICVSEYTKNHLISHMTLIGRDDFVKNKIEVLSGGVDVGSLEAGHNFTVKNSDDKADQKKAKEILFVGAVKPRKGIKEVIDALSFVEGDFIFRIVGLYDSQSSYFLSLVEKIKEYGLEEKVIFTGRVSDKQLSIFYKSADLFIMLSTNNGADFEGYGLVYLEANAYGVPCIGPKDSGTAEAIVDGQTGYTVNQYNSEEVSQKIEQILYQGQINLEACKRWANENSSKNKADKMLDFYKNI